MSSNLSNGYSTWSSFPDAVNKVSTLENEKCRTNTVGGIIINTLIRKSSQLVFIHLFTQLKKKIKTNSN